MEILCLHLGILPHKNIGAVVDIVEKYFPQTPFWAQLPNFSPVEGQFLQFLVNIPGIKSDLLGKKKFLDTKSYLYQSRSVEIIKDFDELTLDILKKYRPKSLSLIIAFSPENAAISQYRLGYFSSSSISLPPGRTGPLG